jgi:hypothetical protein
MGSLGIRLAAMMVTLSIGAAADAQTASPALAADAYMNPTATPTAWASPPVRQSGTLAITRIPDEPKREVALQASAGGLNTDARSGGATYIRNLGDSLALEAGLAVGTGSRYVVTDSQVVLADDRSSYGMVLGQLRINDLARPLMFWTVGAMRELGAHAASDGAAPAGLVLGWGLRTRSPARCCGFRLDLQAFFADHGPELGGRVAFGATLRLD